MMQLPAGLLWQGQLYREVELNEVTGAVRREILSFSGKRAEAYKLHRRLLKLLVKKIGTLVNPSEEMLSALPFCDVEFIFYQVAKELRGNAPFKAKGTCIECGEQLVSPVDWDEVSVRLLEKTAYAENRRIKFVLPRGMKNPRTGEVGKIGYIRLATLADLERVLRSQTAQGQDVNPAKIESALMLALLDALEGFDPERDGEFTQEDLDRMHLVDYEAITAAMREDEPGVHLPQRPCPSCGSPVRLGVDWIADFFLRSRS